MHVVDSYDPADEQSWLRCRVLGFLDTSYYDDVKVAKTVLEPSSLEYVVKDRDTVVGIMDVEVFGNKATIDTVAVHPDYRGGGIGAVLLEKALQELRIRGVATLDAWTREDANANNWYRRNGFTEAYSYLHVYAASGEELARAFPHEKRLVHAFFQADLEDEARLRAEFERVHVCRQYLRATYPAGHCVDHRF